MKKILLLLCVCIGTWYHVKAQVYKTVYIDFGPNDVSNGNITKSPDSYGAYWNNATDPSTSAAAINLIDIKNQSSGASMIVSSGLSKNGINNGGLLSPSSTLLKQLAIATATQDYFYTPTSGSITFKGLNKSRGYVFSLFATRNDPETRITTYTLLGANQYSGVLQTSGSNLGGTGYNGNNRTILVTKTIMPNSNGEIVLNITKTAGTYAYLGLLKLEEVNGVTVQPYCVNKDAHKIAWMGSSVAYGTGSTTGNQGYVYLYTQELKNRFANGKGQGWNVSNISIPGNNTISVLNRWDKDLLPQCSRYVVYALSLGNEGITTGGQQVYDQFKNNLQLLINKARLEGIEPIIANCYARNAYTATEYNYVKQMNALINSWNVPSINLLGADENGSGQWVNGYYYDALHPNDPGHHEFMYSIVPSLFDALDVGKAQPKFITGTSMSLGANSDYKLAITPEETLHPFTLSFDVRTSDFGNLCEFQTTTGTHGLSILPGSGKILYTSAASTGIGGATAVNNNQWHKITITHYYAQGKTLLYVDNVLQGTVSEKINPTKFTLAGETSPSADYRNLMLHRSALNATEVAALNSNQILKSSLEIYSPLDGQGITGSDPLINLAQSLNKVVKIKTNVSCNSNVSLKKTASATGQCNSNEAPLFGVDGNPTTKWCSGNTGDKWLEVDLGQSMQVCGWQVLHAGNESTNWITSDFKLQRKDGNNWVDVDAVTNNTSNSTKRWVTAFDAQVVRLYITKAERNVAGVARIYEFSVFGSPSILNKLPVVNLTSPTNGLQVNAPATIELQANASDVDGTITKVDFYQGATLLGTDNSSPYSYTWTNVPAGNYSVIAKATDNLGGVTTSVQVDITVNQLSGNGDGLTGNYFNGMNFETPKVSRKDATVNFDWGTGSPDPSINIDRFSVRWTGLIEPRYSGSYTFYITNDDGGRLWIDNQLIIDKWRDDAGAVVTGAINLTAGKKYDIRLEYYENGGGAKALLEWSSLSQAREVVPQSQLYSNAIPIVSITSPSNNASFTAPANISLSASTTDADGAVSKVDYYNGSSLIASTSSPFNFTWSNVAAGTYSITAIATDNRGAVKVSAPVSVTVNVPSGIGTVYQDCNYAGYAVALGVGNYTLSQLVSLGVKNDDLSSVKVQSGYEVILYEDDNFTGASLVITANNSCLVNNNFNDIASSLKVLAVTNSSCSGLPTYVENGGYVDGSKVQNVGNMYQCKPYPYTSWCNGAAWAYAPGTGSNWTDAWTLVGSCSPSVPSMSTTTTSSSLSIISPNPATHLLSINLNETSKVTIYNSVGNVALPTTNLEANGTLNIANIPGGIYDVRIETSSQVINVRLVKN